MYFTSLLHYTMFTVTSIFSFLIKFGIAYGLLNLLMFGLAKVFGGVFSAASESKTVTYIIAGIIILFVLMI